MAKGKYPVHIPNPEVKPFSADGTALETVWESRTSPEFFSSPAAHVVGPFLASMVGCQPVPA